MKEGDSNGDGVEHQGGNQQAQAQQAEGQSLSQQAEGHRQADLQADTNSLGQEREHSLISDDESEHSQYIGSSDPGEYEYEPNNDSDEESHDDARRGPSSHIRYDPTTKVPEFSIGMVFDNNVQFKDAVKKYAFELGHDLKFLKNETKRVRVGCRNKCEFRLFAAYGNVHRCFQIKTYVDKRSCGRTNRLKILRADFVVERMKEHIRLYPAIIILALKGLCRIHLNADVGSSTCAKAKRIVIKSIMGDYHQDYA